MPLQLTKAAEIALAIMQKNEPLNGRISQIIAIVARRSTPQKPYRITVNEDRHKAYLGVYDRWIVTFDETAPGIIRATMRDSDSHRQEELTADAHSEAELTTIIETWRDKIEWWSQRLSVYRLQAGLQYHVIQRFTDYYGSVFEVGDVLTFEKQNFLPYHGGYTVVFQQASVYLQEIDNGEILSNFDAYFEELSLQDN